MNDTGIWNLETAQSHGGHKHDQAIVNVITELFTFNTVADLGCGDGWYCKQLKEQLPKTIIHGFEGSIDMRIHGVYDEIFNIDLSEYQSTEQYDLVLCLEVGEHIPKQYEQIFLDNIVNFCKKHLILSWAIPKQGGRGHVNEQSLDYIQNEMKKRNFKIDIEKTKKLRDVAILKWFKNNITVYEL